MEEGLGYQKVGENTEEVQRDVTIKSWHRKTFLFKIIGGKSQHEAVDEQHHMKRYQICCHVSIIIEEDHFVLCISQNWR